MEKMKEEWKIIDGFNDCYKISNYGNVMSNKSGDWKLMKPNILKRCNSVHFCLRDPNFKKMHLLAHRVVAKYFIPNPKNLPQVNHIDGNRSNNHISNLEWVNIRENTSHRSLIRKQPQLLGVGYDKRYGTYCAKIHVNGERIYLGKFKTGEDAHKAYIDAHERFGLTNKYKDESSIFQNPK